MSQVEEQCLKSPQHWLAESQWSPAGCRSQTFLMLPPISSGSIHSFSTQCLTARAAESSRAVWTRTSPCWHSLARASSTHSLTQAEYSPESPMGFVVTTSVTAAIAGGWQYLNTAERVTAWFTCPGRGISVCMGTSSKAATV